ncbi:MAG: helix-turn-helix domain-containing protein [Saccharofermentanales bacterium]|jgi:transcriptional regulator with XRE-family HTH domain
MDTKKIGKFLKELRKDKEITQEQLAEYMHVSGRTVSRWETGMNLPDITILIELSDFYEVSIREILDGEREEQNMEQEKAETILKVAEYSQEENKRIISRGRILFIFGFIVSLVNLIVEWLDLEGEGAWYNLADFIRGFIDGFALVIMLIGVLYTSNRLGKIEEIKRKILKKA